MDKKTYWRPQAERRKAARQALLIDQPCQQCGDTFTPQRSDARFCSGKCRVYAKRLRDTPVPPKKQPATKPKPSRKSEPSKYLYCRTWCAPSISEVRRYEIASELKTKIKLKADYVLRVDGKWVVVTSRNTIDVAKFSNDFLSSKIGDFQRSLPSDWREGLPKPEPKPKPESLDDFLESIPRFREPKVDWQMFGFTSKPNLSVFKKAHRKIALQLHPDHGGDKKAFQQMQLEAEKCLRVIGR